MSSDKIVILLTGMDGQLGRAFVNEVGRFPQIQLVCTNRKMLDITDADSIAKAFDTHTPDVCINCSAYTAVDRAESEATLAYRVNAEGPALLAETAYAGQCKLIHFSSDYVYHIHPGRPLTEEDDVRPKSVYARSKLAGENAILSTSADHVIFRTAWLYAAAGQNFVQTMLRLSETKKIVRVVDDQMGSPTFAGDLAACVLDILAAGSKDDLSGGPFRGIYNYSNEGKTSWHGFAVKIFEYANRSVDVIPIATSDYPTPAQRPPWSVLSKAKLKTQFGISVPHWADSLAKCLAEEAN